MKVQQVGSATILLYAFFTYVPQFFFHFFNEHALSDRYRGMDGSVYYAGFILFFFVLVFFLNAIIPRISNAWVACVRPIGQVFTSSIFVTAISLVMLFLALHFYITQDMSFRQSESISNHGWNVACLFFMKTYVYAWTFYHYLALIRGIPVNYALVKVQAIFFLVSLMLSITGSLGMIPVIWLLIFVVTPRLRLQKFFVQCNQSVNQSVSTIVLRVVIGVPVLIVFLVGIISMGFINKMGVDATIDLWRFLGAFGLFEQIMERVSSSYAAAISFSVNNIFNLSLYEQAFAIPVENVAYRLSLIFSLNDPFPRPEITQINRLNYLSYSADTSLPRAGASPGLVGSAFFAAPFPLGFILIAMYTVIILRLVNMAFQTIYVKKRFWAVLLAVAFTYRLFESPVDYLNFIDPSFVYLILFVLVLLIISSYKVRM